MKTVVPPTFRSPLGYDMQSSEVVVTLEPHDRAALWDYLEDLRVILRTVRPSDVIRMGGVEQRAGAFLDRVETRVKTLRRLLRISRKKGEVRYYTSKYPDDLGTYEETVLRFALAIRVNKRKCPKALESYRKLRSNSMVKGTYATLTLAR